MDAVSMAIQHEPYIMDLPTQKDVLYRYDVEALVIGPAEASYGMQMYVVKSRKCAIVSSIEQGLPQVWNIGDDVCFHFKPMNTRGT
jgi:hypothetical protein